MSALHPPPSPAPRALFFARWAVVLLVALGLALAWRLGAFEEVQDPRSFARTVVAMGPWGYLWFVVAFVALQPFGAPGTVFVFAAPLIWPWPVAFALSMIGTMGASVVGFSFSRFVARDWVAARIPERFRKFDQALERNAFLTVFILRLVFWMPQVLHGFLGVSKVPFWTHFWGSLLGYMPPLLVISVFASRAFDEEGRFQPRALLILGALVAASLLLAAALGRYQRRRAGLRPSSRTPT